MAETAKNLLKLKGKIVEVMPGTKFRVAVDLPTGQHILIGYIAGKMRMHYIKLNLGDTVEVEVSPSDLKHGRITYRL